MTVFYSSTSISEAVSIYKIRSRALGGEVGWGEEENMGDISIFSGLYHIRRDFIVGGVDLPPHVE